MDVIERQELIARILGDQATEMRIRLDEGSGVIRVAPAEKSGAHADFELAVRCTGGCALTYSLTVRRADFETYRAGVTLIQNCFPYIEPPFRELLITGICPLCWRKMFGSPEDCG